GFSAASLFGKRHDSDGVAVSVRDIKGLFILAERHSLWARSRQSALREAYVNSLDVLIRGCVNHGNAIGVWIGHKRPRAFGIRLHRGRMPVHANVFLHEGLAIERDHGDRRIVPAGNISPRLLPVFEEYT